MSDFLMPRLSDTMEEGTILTWLKEDGDDVAAGDALVEVESDKATMTVDAEVAGTLKVLVGAGETVAVGVPIATIGGGADGAASEAAPASAPAAVAAPARAAVANGDVRASPVARRMARQLGLTIAEIPGTGSGGRITKADVEAAAAGGTSAPGPAASPSTGDASTPASPSADAPGSANGASSAATPPAPAAPAPADADAGRGAVDRRELSRLQAVVARRMVQSKTEAPEFLLTIDADMTEAVRLRGELKALAADGVAVPSLNDFVVRAAGVALARHPDANAAFVDGAVERYGRVNVGVAVAGEGTLIVPTVFDADRKSLGAIAADTRRLALAARDGAVTPAELGSGTFTVSNLGMFGIAHFTAVINPPQAAILAVGQLETRPVWDGEAFVPRALMTMTLSCDHRVLYGADAARFLAAIRDGLQQPLLLAL
jgi:pyruvate dehydrogenase E2 component (dihydrolipoamide acetyltransferase)